MSKHGKGQAEHWLDSLEARHTAELTRPELLKAIRALSSRYVERRAQLPDRSALDSAGKRAAFATFYAPLHFLTTAAIVRALGATLPPASRLLDLGCGTGTASAAWALAGDSPVTIAGVDKHPWAVTEAEWTWRALGLRGQARRGDLVAALEREAALPRQRSRGPTSVLLAWSANELDASSRARLLSAVITMASRGDAVLILEPLAHGAAPWWPSWRDALDPHGARADEWKFPAALPASLEALNDAAGFETRQLSARSLWLPGALNLRAGR